MKAPPHTHTKGTDFPSSWRVIPAAKTVVKMLVQNKELAERLKMEHHPRAPPGTLPLSQGPSGKLIFGGLMAT